ncbi:hypothetical protein Sinac_1791 [Singulisphaera acidiphila DSM 18658]|uniref:Zinc-ribbon domain-containing protein n=2 Tax=Singulisphaera acidiphila TaxID=466153 RepID=L0DBC2_SINAD|nr:hypothetical protein Sinac_1791 [Singulisphaera acidiphila DSM 18658]
MNCHACQHQISSEASFCPSCGKPQGAWVPNPNLPKKMGDRDKAWVIIAGLTATPIAILIVMVIAAGVRSKFKPPGLAAGTELEIIGRPIAADRGVYDALRGGTAMTDFKTGRQKFRVEPGAAGRVIEQNGEAVHFEVVSGKMKGRDGWLSRDGVRLPPTEAESAKDVKFGLTLLERRKLYAEVERNAKLAVREADRRVPDAINRTSRVGIPAVQKKWSLVLNEILKENSRRLYSKYSNLTKKQIGLIISEGSGNSWPEPEVPKP